MIHWGWGEVLSCVEERGCYQTLEVRMQWSDDLRGGLAKAIHYADVMPLIQVGDEVLLNTTAVDLDLGSGGYHFVCAVYREGVSVFIAPSVDWQHRGHLMKLRYTPMQRAVQAVEEESSGYSSIFMERQTLAGIPVLIGELHSMLPVAVCWLRYLEREQCAKSLSIAYIMSDGGALPLAISRHVSTLRHMGWLQGTVTYGNAYGGDLEALNKFTALIAARHVLHADVIIVCMGPGIAGTGTALGHTATEVAEIIHAVSLLGGKPVVMPRLSFVDSRERHTGLSHHLLTTMSQLTLRRAYLPLPSGLSSAHEGHIRSQLKESGCEQLHDISWMNELDVSALQIALNAYPLSITTMGRGITEDAVFFHGVAAAGQLVWNFLQR